jgi:hypothetical protein
MNGPWRVIDNVRQLGTWSKGGQTCADPNSVLQREQQQYHTMCQGFLMATFHH